MLNIVGTSHEPSQAQMGSLRNTTSGAKQGAVKLTLCEPRTWQSSRGEVSM